MREKQKNNGITLIALVVTIVVLLILAAVSISMLTGENGIIKQAQESKEDTRGATAKEEVDLWKSNIKMDNVTNSTTAEKEENLLNRLKNDGTLTTEEVTKLKNGETIIIGKSEISLGIINDGGDDTSIAGKGYETETDIEIGNVPVKIPGGATVSGIAGEYEDVEDGVVIYIVPEGEEIADWEADEDNNGIKDVQEKYSQFVWVPVPNAIAEDMNDDGTVDETDIDLMIAVEKYPMAIAINDTDYRGVLYDFNLSDDSIVVTDRYWAQDLNDYREPAYVTDTSSGDGSSYNNVGITKSSLQTTFNTMVNKVSSNKGFWVGRYETSDISAYSSQDTNNKIGVIRGTTKGVYNVSWYRMYAQQKEYSNLADISLTSSMIWGSQWDQIMIWMKDIENVSQNSKYIINSIGMGNYGEIENVNDGWSSKKPAPTGYQDSYKVKNIYDLAGNVSDWTLETHVPTSRVARRI